MQTITIELNDGKIIETTVDTYVSLEMAVLLNNRESTVVAIGDLVLNRNVVKVIRPKSTVQI